MTTKYRVYEIDGEDLIVASSRKEMRKAYEEQWGDEFQGHRVRVVPPDEPIMMFLSGSGDDTDMVPVEAEKLAEYGPAYYQTS